MSLSNRLVAYCLFLLASPAVAQTHVPDMLKDWEQWVLDGKEYMSCPFYFDRSPDQRDAFVCSWPGELKIDVGTGGARFAQEWTVFAKDQWVALPGNSKFWPEEVRIGDRLVEVVARNGIPSIKLATGTSSVEGEFRWDERPGVLRVPPRSGLIVLNVDGSRVERPEFDRTGVFLGERERDSRARNSVRTVVHRLVVDDIPTRLITRLQVDVSGNVREEVFGPVLPDGFVPMNLESPIPARLEADGRLRLQVRPGRWTITLSARGTDVENSISPPLPGTNMATEEIWSYRSNDELRVSAVEDLPPVDPAQVGVPSNWRSFPAFRLTSDASFQVVERSRGVVSASNELSLSRTMWLDFDGEGFVVKDSIGGEMRTNWRLDMYAPFSLLSATENGQSLLVTRGEGDARTGIEVRQSSVGVAAIGRVDIRGSMPTTGWDARFASVETTLNLPPGHKLLMAPGVDRAAGSWMSQWQLLDFFLVLIITIGAWRLFGRAAGIIALGALVLSFHEIAAPSWLWLNMLVASALIRVAPAGRLRSIVRGYQVVSGLALVAVLVPFIAGQVRIAIYPQLESQVNQYGLYSYASRPAADDELLNAPALMRQAEVAKQSMVVEAKPEDSQDTWFLDANKSTTQFSRYAPNTVIQAGPGIPAWRWNTYSLTWSGPVDAQQAMRLVVMPRWLVSTLRGAIVALILLFAGVIAADTLRRKWTLPGGLTLGGPGASNLVIVGIFAGLAAYSPHAEAQYPDPILLEQLQQRLTEAPDCAPRCAEIASADVEIRTDLIVMKLSVHAMEKVAIPLPGSTEGWRPQSIVVSSGDGVRIVRAPDSTLWMYVEAGNHALELQGAIPPVDTLEIPFPAPPRSIEVESEAWVVAGTLDRRLTAGSLQLSRRQQVEAAESESQWDTGRFPGFARVERVVELGVDWRVRTTVQRVAPTEGALTLEIPLLAGESVVSGDHQVGDGRILVTMNPRQQSVAWTSNLQSQSPLVMQAAGGSSWREVWYFVIGNSWNTSFDGIPRSNVASGADGVRVEVFHPRNNESLTMAAVRPEASSGSTLAFDSVNLSFSEGSSSRAVALQLSYRSTRGSQHAIQLPENAEVTMVWIDGREQTLAAEDGLLTLPVLPGEHTVAINWREDSSASIIARTSAIDIGAPASNIDMTVTHAVDRWLLATDGPKLGPAVLYWSELVALIIFALLLGRFAITPLKTTHWLLLGLGFSTFDWPVLALVAVWLLLCGAREKMKTDLNWWQFNLQQLVIAGVTIIALLNIVTSLPSGLLGAPDMHVDGHKSYANVLSWFADASDSELPVATIVTAPLWVYKLLILAWALWLSFALIRWLPWVWHCFSKDGYWRSRKTSQSMASTGSDS